MTDHSGYGSGGYGEGSYGGTLEEDPTEPDPDPDPEEPEEPEPEPDPEEPEEPNDEPEDEPNEDNSPMTDAPEITGEVNADELTAFIDTRIEEQTSNISESEIEETVRNVIAERDEGQIDYELLAGKIIEKIGEDSSGSTA